MHWWSTGRSCGPTGTSSCCGEPEAEVVHLLTGRRAHGQIVYLFMLLAATSDVSGAFLQGADRFSFFMCGMASTTQDPLALLAGWYMLAFA